MPKKPEARAALPPTMKANRAPHASKRLRRDPTRLAHKPDVHSRRTASRTSARGIGQAFDALRNNASQSTSGLLLIPRQPFNDVAQHLVSAVHAQLESRRRRVDDG